MTHSRNPRTIDQVIGARLRRRREQLGLTVTAVAAKAEIAQPYLTQLEQGQRSPGIDVLVRLCDTLDVSADWLLGRTGKMT
jgi:transcriptional regulator with XRE-family HTH domain